MHFYFKVSHSFSVTYIETLCLFTDFTLACKEATGDDIARER